MMYHVCVCVCVIGLHRVGIKLHSSIPADRPFAIFAFVFGFAQLLMDFIPSLIKLLNSRIFRQYDGYGMLAIISKVKSGSKSKEVMCACAHNLTCIKIYYGLIKVVL